MVSPQATSEAESRDALFTLGKATTCFPQEEWAGHFYAGFKHNLALFNSLQFAIPPHGSRLRLTPALEQ